MCVCMRICVLACGGWNFVIKRPEVDDVIFVSSSLPYIVSRVSHLSQSSPIGSSLPSHFVLGILCLFHGLGLLVGHHACWISKFRSSLLPAKPVPQFLYVSFLAEPLLGFLPTPPGAGLYCAYVVSETGGLPGKLSKLSYIRGP